MKYTRLIFFEILKRQLPCFRNDVVKILFCIFSWRLTWIKSVHLSTSLARGTRPWTEATTDHARVDMFSTTLSDAPAEIYHKISHHAKQSKYLFSPEKVPEGDKQKQLGKEENFHGKVHEHTTLVITATNNKPVLPNCHTSMSSSWSWCITLLCWSWPFHLYVIVISDDKERLRAAEK